MLNEKLYNALEQVFGTPVRVSNADRQGVYTLPPKKSVCFQAKQVEYAQVNDWGETYNVCCPVCGDNRYRLYFSYLFGSRVIPKGRSTPVEFGKKLLHCFNEACHRSQNMWPWVDKVIEVMEGAHILDMNDSENTVLSSKDYDKAVENVIPLPVPNYPLADESVPVELNRFLLDRELDSYVLDSQYMCRFVPAGAKWKDGTDEVEFYDDRLLIPIFQKRRLVSWQARTLSQTPTKLKYLFPPGCRKSEYLYNMDTAWKYKNIVLVEGVTDVWRVGTDDKLNVAAVGLFGKTLSMRQMELIQLLWGYDGKGIVLLDPDAHTSAVKAARFLEAYNVFPRGVDIIFLEDKDPGDMTHLELMELIDEKLSENS